MAILPRCLCLVLTLWMVVSRPSAATGFGRSGPSPWWGTQEEKRIRQTTLKFREAGDFASAERTYRAGWKRALEVHDPLAAIRYLTGVGACQVLEFRYREAFESLWQARRMALATKSDLELGAIAFNLSSLYLQVGDVDSALRAAEEGLSSTHSLSHPYYATQLLLQLARIHTQLQDGQAEELLAKAIEAARTQGDRVLEARGWDLLGEAWLDQNQLNDAERALDHAFRMRLNWARADLPFSYGLLGALKLAQGDLQSADRFTERALGSHAGAPEFLLRHQRGRIRLAQGDVAGALKDFSAAIELAVRWRREVLPAASSLAGANVDLERQVFDSFVETAAREALRTGDSRLKIESIQALELNRAASLRESLALGAAWRKGLPLEYWEVLAQLRAEESRTIQSGTERTPRTDSLRLKLTEMEAKAGMVPVDISQENFRTQSSLIHFQHGLSSSELLLSYFLGEHESYVWAITRKSVSLHRLPPAGRIRTEVKAFRDGIREGRAEAEPLGRKLYTQLMGNLGRDEREKPQWLLSLGDALLDLPFAPLETRRGSGDKKAKYLIEKHSLQIVPGAMLLSGDRSASNGSRWMLAVGDPIYNAADPRWQDSQARAWTWTARADTSGQLARLVASAVEVESSARSWRPDRAMLLEGPQARREPFLQALKQRPSIIHLATHVLMPPARRSEAMIAFGLGQHGEAELLSTSEVAMLHVPGAVVVMNGCESGAGDIRAGAGSFGLTRAWEMAGASGVIDTRWPVRDSNGEIFVSFYRHLRTESTAEALRHSQIEAIHSGTWRAGPAYWASYQLTGSAR